MRSDSDSDSGLWPLAHPLPPVPVPERRRGGVGGFLGRKLHDEPDRRRLEIVVSEVVACPAPPRSGHDQDDTVTWPFMPRLGWRAEGCIR